MKKYEVELTLLEPMLGTVPKDKDVYAAYIKTKGEDNDDEMDTIEEIEEKGWTGFHMKDGGPVIYNYMIKGFLKNACATMNRVPKSKSKEVKAYKKVINGLVFVTPRLIPFDLNGSKMDTLERPLRAQTPKGERVTLARSDTCPVGSKLKFTITVLAQVSKPLLIEWLDYGEFCGLGQWRNADYGRFDYTLKEIE